MFYLFLPFIFYLIKRSRKVFVLFLIYLLSFAYSEIFNQLATTLNISFFHEIARQMPGQLGYFVSGIAIYCFYDI